MRKLLFIILIFILGFYAGKIYNNPKREIQIDKQRVEASELTQTVQVARLERALKSYNSPLSAQAAFFVGVSSRYSLDYRLLPAIAFAESTLCKNYPWGSHNCWGWGSGQIHFDSFEEAIDKIAYNLATHRYYKKWRAEKGNIFKLAQTYNGPVPQKWTNTVIYFMEEVEKK